MKLSSLFGTVVFAAVMACSNDGGGTTPPVTQVLATIAPASATVNLNAGQQSTISMTARDASNAVIASASGYIYTSSAPTIAQVSTSGTITGLAAGNATITVSLTLNGVSKTATVAATVGGTLPTVATVVAGAASNDFTPALLVIARTGTVTYTFGARTHNVEFGGTAGAPANIGNTSAVNVARTFANAGTFAYTCTLHAGMNGSVFVP